MIVFWSAKGGSGTSVVSALLSLAFAAAGRRSVLVDVGGDQTAVLGLVQEPASVGLHQWLATEADVAPDALARLTRPVADGLRLLPGGAPLDLGPNAARRAVDIPAAFSDSTVVVDAGVCRRPNDIAAALAGGATTSLLVTRPCYLSLTRAASLPVRPTGIVVIDEPSRSLSAKDVAAVLGAPVVAKVGWDPNVARAVDAGRLTHRRFKPPKTFVELVARLNEGQLENAG